MAGEATTADPTDTRGIAAARDILRHCRRVAVMSGAGISVDSGIPDFRGPQGLFTGNPEAITWFTRAIFERSAEARKHFWSLRHALLDALPNAGHRAIASLEKQGRLTGVATQNIDGLHHKAGNSPERVHELHGSVRNVVCLRCGQSRPVAEMLLRLESDEDPHCAACGGVLKPDLVMYGEMLDQAVFSAAQEAAERCDVLVAVGSTLDVFPAAYIPQIAVERGVPLVIVNLGPTRYDDVAAVRVSESSTVALPRLFEAD